MLEFGRQCGPQRLDRAGAVEPGFLVVQELYLTRISENFNVQFRAEFLNILNRANLAVPGKPHQYGHLRFHRGSDGRCRLVNLTTTTAREIQFGVKVSW